MHEISELMTKDHRSCDDFLAVVEKAVNDQNWQLAQAEFPHFRDALLNHFEAEESILFPLFEKRTGMYQGPPQSKTLARGRRRLEFREASWSAPALWRFGAGWKKVWRALTQGRSCAPVRLEPSTLG